MKRPNDKEMAGANCLRDILILGLALMLRPQIWFELDFESDTKPLKEAREGRLQMNRSASNLSPLLVSLPATQAGVGGSGGTIYFWKVSVELCGYLRQFASHSMILNLPFGGMCRV